MIPQSANLLNDVGSRPAAAVCR